MRLARDFQILDVDRLSRLLPMRLFRRWAAFYAIDIEDLEERKMEADVQARMVRR
jgi:hypothetical protein